MSSNIIPISIEDYSKAVSKGRRLLALLGQRFDGSDTPADEGPTESPQSVYTKYSDLENNGYVYQERPLEVDFKYLGPCLRNLGVDDKIDKKGGENQQVYHVHDHMTLKDGVFYRPTEAYFSQVINRRDGVLIAHTNNTPRTLAVWREAKPPIENHIPLEHWSDVAFLQLLTPPPVPSSPPPSPFLAARFLSSASSSAIITPITLNYIIRFNILNTITVGVVKRILAIHKIDVEELPAWPGLCFDVDAEEAQALLGTPDGAGCVWLLAQHESGLGKREVRKVSMFLAEDKRKAGFCRWPSLLVWVGERGGGGGNGDDGKGKGNRKMSV